MHLTQVAEVGDLEEVDVDQEEAVDEEVEAVEAVEEVEINPPNKTTNHIKRSSSVKHRT